MRRTPSILYVTYPFEHITVSTCSKTTEHLYTLPIKSIRIINIILLAFNLYSLCSLNITQYTNIMHTDIKASVFMIILEPLAPSMYMKGIGAGTNDHCIQQTLKF